MIALRPIAWFIERRVALGEEKLNSTT